MFGWNSSTVNKTLALSFTHLFTLITFVIYFSRRKSSFSASWWDFHNAFVYIQQYQCSALQNCCQVSWLSPWLSWCPQQHRQNTNSWAYLHSRSKQRWNAQVNAYALFTISLNIFCWNDFQWMHIINKKNKTMFISVNFYKIPALGNFIIHNSKIVNKTRSHSPWTNYCTTMRHLRSKLIFGTKPCFWITR